MPVCRVAPLEMMHDGDAWKKGRQHPLDVLCTKVSLTDPMLIIEVSHGTTVPAPASDPSEAAPYCCHDIHGQMAKSVSRHDILDDQSAARGDERREARENHIKGKMMDDIDAEYRSE